MLTYQQRAARAFLLLAVREGRRITQGELADKVAATLGRAVTQGAVAKQLGGTVPEGLDAMIALASALGVDPGWLYFGSASAAPAPVGADFAEAGHTRDGIPMVAEKGPQYRGAKKTSQRLAKPGKDTKKKRGHG